ncbi:MAG: sigma 54-dependent Fis family transcriptional regulator [Myxococcales bacterium]|nr:sigma 54-dependent Fis family transcriptional regulator [Myxococcales bacterium]
MEDVRTLLRTAATTLPDGTFLVEVAEGPDVGSAIELDGASPARLLVGTSATADLRLTDASVSRRHVSLEIVGNRLEVRDLGSTNGTFVDHVRVGQAWLSGGETLRVGGTALRVTHRAAGSGAMVPEGEHFGRVWGQSRAMRRIYPLAQKLAASFVPVLIEGETGTGKEVLAESLHEQGPLAAGPFVVFDCTAVPPNLVESELFGHERGAFTGAVTSRKGVFEQAHGGTLLIDEIGDLDLNLQPKLLRAIERGEVRRVGGDKWIHFEARILCATRRDLDREIQAGRFRDDLFHRLAVGRIELPPLRERAGDVRFLAPRIWTALGGVGTPSPRLVARWEEHAWPGNLRELRNAVARALALGEDSVTEDAAAALPHDAYASGASASGAPSEGDGDFLEAVINEDLPFAAARAKINLELERRYVERALTAHNGNVSRAADASGLARRHFQRLKARRAK